MGDLNPFHGKKHTAEAINKMRIASSKQYIANI
jgi:hypothetical protein